MCGLCSFDLDVMGGSIAPLPGLEAWLFNIICSKVLRYILKSHMMFLHHCSYNILIAFLTIPPLGH